MFGRFFPSYGSLEKKSTDEKDKQSTKKPMETINSLKDINLIPEAKRTSEHWMLLASIQITAGSATKAIKKLNQIPEEKRMPEYWRFLAACQLEACGETVNFYKIIQLIEQAISNLNNIPQNKRTTKYWEYLALCYYNAATVFDMGWFPLNIFIKNRYASDVIRCYEDAVKSLMKISPEKMRRKHFVKMAIYEHELGNRYQQIDYNIALSHYINSISNFNKISPETRSIENLRDMLSIKGYVGEVYCHVRKNYIDAISTFQEAKEIFDLIPKDQLTTDDKFYLAMFEYLMSCCYTYSNRFSEAEECHGKVLQLIDEIGLEFFGNLPPSLKLENWSMLNDAILNIHLCMTGMDIKSKKQLLQEQARRYLSYIDNVKRAFLANKYLIDKELLSDIAPLLSSAECIFHLMKGTPSLTYQQAACWIDEPGLRALILHGQNVPLAKNLPDELWNHCLSFLVNDPEHFCFFAAKKALTKALKPYKYHSILHFFRPQEANYLIRDLKKVEQKEELVKLLVSQIKKPNKSLNTKEQKLSPYHQTIEGHLKRLV